MEICRPGRALLLAGGHGTRLRPFTFSGNKHMMPIANKPLIFYALEDIMKLGIKEVGIVVGPHREGIQSAIRNGASFGVNVTYIEQPEPKGIAHAIGVARDFLGNEPFVTYLGDNLLRNGAGPLVDKFSSRCEGVLGVATVKEPSRFGVLEVKEDIVLRVTEKPKNPKTNDVMIGVYVFTPAIFSAIDKLRPSWRGEFELSEAVQILIDSGMRILAHRVDGWWKDAGRPEDLLEANRLVLDDIAPCIEATVSEKSVLIGRVVAGQGTKIHANTRLVGPTVIGNECEIGPNARIGPYVSIGERSHIRDAELENSIVMTNCRIECKLRVADSIVGPGSRVFSSESRWAKLVLGEQSLVHF